MYGVDTLRNPVGLAAGIIHGFGNQRALERKNGEDHDRLYEELLP